VVLSTKSNLNNHQRSNISCLNIQESLHEVKGISKTVECEFCHKKYSNNSIQKHLKICKQKSVIETTSTITLSIRLQEEINIVTSEAVKGDYKTLLSIILQHTTNESLPSEDSEAVRN
jgi:SOS-response transcriptional repressor LexA